LFPLHRQRTARVMTKKDHKGKHHGASSDNGKAPVTPRADPTGETTAISVDDYQSQLHLLQVELVKLQRHFIKCGDKILVLIEGRDAAGKDGSIKRIVEHLSPRETRVVALGKPSGRDLRGWYFHRYVPYLPVAEERVVFNRSGYNRAGVEHVLGFCSKKEHVEFMLSVPKFEEMLVNPGIRLLKYYLDIGKPEQIRRLADRERSPLKQWKTSPTPILRSSSRQTASPPNGWRVDARLRYSHSLTGKNHAQISLDPRNAARCRFVRLRLQHLPVRRRTGQGQLV